MESQEISRPVLTQEDSNNLDLLRIFYIVKGVLSSLTGLYFLVMSFGLPAFFGRIAMDTSSVDPSFFPFTLITIIMSFAAIFVIAVAVCCFLSARAIQNRTQYNLVFVTGILCCLTGILGIALGVFTFVEITKPEVKALLKGG